VPEQVCRDVEAEKCEIVHTKTPESKANQKAIRVCNNNIGSSNNPEFGEDFELIQSADVRNQDVPASEEDASRIAFTFSD
jgi:hypothetical protein